MATIRRVAAIAAIGLLLGASGCSTTGPGPNTPTSLPGGSGVVMKITPAKSEFAAGEPIALAIELTNAETRTCGVSRVPDGVLVFVSLTRDGQPVVPGFGTANYIDGMASFLRKNVVPVEPAASLSEEIHSERENALDKRPVLETSTLGALDEGSLTYWPIDEPGSYVLSARYVPSVPDTADLCRSSGDPVPAQFTVHGA